MYLTLDLIKKHLNIDADFTDDDDYLTSLGEVAEKVVQEHIDKELSDYTEDGGSIPTPLLHAMLLFVGDMYQSRESVVFNSSPVELPLSYNYLLSLYKNYLGR